MNHALQGFARRHAQMVDVPDGRHPPTVSREAATVSVGSRVRARRATKLRRTLRVIVVTALSYPLCGKLRHQAIEPVEKIAPPPG